MRVAEQARSKPGNPHHRRLGEERRRAIYDYIVAYRAQHGISPSVMEIAMGLGIANNRAGAHVDRLVAEGRLRRRPGAARSLVPVE